MVVTTNYDDLLERTFDALRRPYLRIVEQQDVPESGTTDRTCVVKFHGDAAAGEALVLSRDDYDTFFQNRPAMALLLEGLLLNQTFFFVGYSLRDPNFRQIFSRIAAMLRDARRPAFATTVDPYPPQAARQWERKRLSLLSPGGGSSNARAHAVLRWLDALGDSVEPPNSVFLTRDAGDDSDAALAAVRQALHRVGDAVESAVKSGVDAACARQLAPVLEFLASRGWRPRSTRLSFVWERLADAVPEDDREHARWLDRALQTSEKLDDVRRLRSHALRHDSDAGDRGAVGSKPSAPPHQ
jgi:hypothetical protein